MAVKRYIKGMYKDTSHVDQPEGTWRHAKNMVLNEIKGGISNEKGFTRFGQLNLNTNLGLWTNGLISNPAFYLDSNDGAHATQGLWTGVQALPDIVSNTSYNSNNTDGNGNPLINYETNNRERIIGKIEISDGRVVLFTTKLQYGMIVDDSQSEDEDPVLVPQYIPDNNWWHRNGQDHAIYLIEKDESIKLVLRSVNGGKFIVYDEAGVGGNQASSHIIVTGVDADLKFNKNYPIEGTYKINSQGHLHIYWTDNLNPPRSLNVTRQMNPIPADGVDPDLYTDPTSEYYYPNHIYNKLVYESPNKNYVDRLNLFPHSGPIPSIEFKTINPGGGLQSGVYQLALAYVDKDLNPTNYLTVSNPVSIVEELETIIPIERYNGCPAGVSTGKSISWAVSNLNTDYDYLRIGIVKTIGGVEEAINLKDIPITTDSTSTYVTFTGLEGFAPGAVDEIMVDSISYSTAKTLNQLDNVLYVGNLTGTQDVGFQKYANSIQLIPTMEEIPYFDPFELTTDRLMHGYSLESTPFRLGESNPIFESDFYTIARGYRSPLYNVMKRGYTRDEVYAFYIAFVMNDGTMSYAYHIPGRPPMENVNIMYAHGEMPEVDQPEGYEPLGPYYVNETDKVKSGQEPDQLDNWLDLCWSSNGGNRDGDSGWDGVTSDLWSYSWGYFPKELKDHSLYSMSSGLGRLFHFYEFSYLTGDNGQPSNNMNYWENANEFYPDVENYDIYEINAEGAEELMGTLRNKNVRHHHFPSNQSTYRALDKEQLSNITPQTWTDYWTNDVTQDGQQEFSATWEGMYPTAWEQGAGSNKQLVLADQGDTYTTTTPSWTGPIPPEGTCIYCEVTGGNAPLPDQGASDADGDIGGNCDAWFAGKVTDNNNFAGGVKIQIGTAGDALEDCGCSETVSPHWTDNNNNVINPCAGGTLEEEPIQGCAGGGIFVGNGDNENLDNLGGENGDVDSATLFSGTCKWILPLNWQGNQLIGYGFDTDGDGVGDVISSEGLDDDVEWIAPDTGFFQSGFDGLYTSRNVNILGFHLKNISIPDEIKEKVQGFRIYYAKRDHLNRRILGQNLAIPMRQISNIIDETGCGDADLPEVPEESDLNVSSNPNLSADKSKWLAEGFVRGFEHFGTNSEQCSFEGINFHDFYLLNSHNSISHATHLKIENLWSAHSFKGPYTKKNKEVNYSGDTLISIEFPDADYNEPEDEDPYWTWDWENVASGCTSKYRQSSFHVDNEMFNTDNFTVKDATGGVLNFPIRENAKTYLRGDAIFTGAEALGFGYDIYNIKGESSIAMQLNKDRGLPPRAGRTINSFRTYNLNYKNPNVSEGLTYSWDPFLSTNDAYNLATNKEDVMLPAIYNWANAGWTFPVRDHRAEHWQTNLHAFKLDMYNDLDTNELVFTGYEVIGDDFINMNKEDGTTITYPDGIFGGDTFICRHGWRTSYKSTFKTNADRFPGFNSRRLEYSTAYMTIVESTDNINLRHMGERANNADSFLPLATPNTFSWLPAGLDLTYNPGDDETGNIRYNEDYSKLNTIKTAIPLPTRMVSPDNFPTRIHRSVKADASSITDNFRIFLANQYRDLPKNKGELNNMAAVNNLLFFHMQDTLFKTAGKQKMEMKDGSEAFIGSGDIFEQEPEEVLQTYYGYGGNLSKFSSLTTRYGYFFLDYSARKVFLLAEGLLELSAIGLEKWFFENIPFKFEGYPGWQLNGNTFVGYPLDNPFGEFGFNATWDPILKRIILTKKELVPTKWFDYALENNSDGFNLIYNPSLDRYDSGWFGTNADTPQFDETVLSDGWGLDQGYTENAQFSFLLTPLNYTIPFINNEDDDDFATYSSGVTTATLTYEECVASSTEDFPAFPSAGCSSGTTPCYCFYPSFVQDDHGVVQTSPKYLIEEKGWTISYYPELQIWVSFHDYKPSVYILSGEKLLSSLSSTNEIYEHHSGPYGLFYRQDWTLELWSTEYTNQFGTTEYNSSEFEFIHSESKNDSKVFSNIGYIADIKKGTETINLHDPGFTSFYVYNTHQISGEIDLTYLTNIRKTSDSWKINKFRDMAKLYTINGTEQTSREIPMFNTEGMNKTVNDLYIDLEKEDLKQQKFIDKWLGISLKNSNISNNLVTLYATEVGIRKYFR